MCSHVFALCSPQPSPFFTQQLTAFEVWLEHGNERKPPPEQLPIVLQVRAPLTSAMKCSKSRDGEYEWGKVKENMLGRSKLLLTLRLLYCTVLCVLWPSGSAEPVPPAASPRAAWPVPGHGALGSRSGQLLTPSFLPQLYLCVCFGVVTYHVHSVVALLWIQDVLASRQAPCVPSVHHTHFNTLNMFSASLHVSDVVHRCSIRESTMYGACLFTHVLSIS